MQDIHTHLYWESYDADRDAVVSRARAAGIDRMIAVGCTVEESKQCVALTERYPEVLASIGIHPQEYNDLGFKIDDGRILELRKFAQNKKVVAIGECGLEYYSHDNQKTISAEQKAHQRAGFLAQVALAQEFQLPLIVHCRPSFGTQDAYRDMYEILKTNDYRLKTILHCYMGDTEITKKFLELPNLYFSFTGNITYPVKKTLVGTKDDLSETVKLVPLERIFAETDCPFLAPQSHRGKRNEPAYVKEVVTKIAKLHGIDASVVEEATNESFKKVFVR